MCSVITPWAISTYAAQRFSCAAAKIPASSRASGGAPFRTDNCAMFNDQLVGNPAAGLRLGRRARTRDFALRRATHRGAARRRTAARCAASRPCAPPRRGSDPVPSRSTVAGGGAGHALPHARHDRPDAALRHLSAGRLLGRPRAAAPQVVHSARYERLGGIEPFLRQYFGEVLTLGYLRAPLEQEAVRMSRRLVKRQPRVNNYLSSCPITHFFAAT